MDKEKQLKKCRKCISCQFMFDCQGVENPDMCIRYYERKNQNERSQMDKDRHSNI